MEDPHFIFTAPFNVNVIESKGQVQVFLEGDISNTDPDLVNDIVTKNCLESMQRQIMERNIKLDVEHEAFRGKNVEEKELNKTKIPAGKILGAMVKAGGENRFVLAVKSVLNNNRKDFESLKGNVVDKFLDAYSIAYIATKIAHKTVEGQKMRLLDDVRLLNVALTGNAVNTTAENRRVFMKSMDAIEEYQKEKKSNPELENKLEVKANELKCPKCGHKYPEKKDHTELNYRRLNMSEDKNTEPEKPEDNAEKKDETSETPAETTEETGDEQKSELKAMSERMDKIEKENAELKAAMKKPVHKAMVEPQVKDNPANQKPVNPLDLIG